MDNDFEEDFSPPAKRRRISRQGEPSTFLAFSLDNASQRKSEYDFHLRSPPSTGSMSQTEGRILGKVNQNGDEGMAIVDTSDNEEILLGDTYDNLNEDAATLFARRPSHSALGPPTGSPYNSNQQPFKFLAIQSEETVTPTASLLLVCIPLSVPSDLIREGLLGIFREFTS